MPADRFTHKANTAKRKRQWQHVYDSAKSRGMSDAEAIIEANGVIKDQVRRDRKKKK